MKNFRVVKLADKMEKMEKIKSLVLSRFLKQLVFNSSIGRLASVFWRVTRSQTSRLYNVAHAGTYYMQAVKVCKVVKQSSKARTSNQQATSKQPAVNQQSTSQARARHNHQPDCIATHSKTQPPTTSKQEQATTSKQEQASKNQEPRTQ